MAAAAGIPPATSRALLNAVEEVDLAAVTRLASDVELLNARHDRHDGARTPLELAVSAV